MRVIDVMVGPVERVTLLATRVLAPNAGPMTLDGTNSYVVRHPDSAGVVVVDPGPSDAEHLDRLVAFGEVELILLSHWHRDHSSATKELSERTSAPVRALDPEFCINGSALTDGEEIHAAGTLVRVLATPGHTADSASFQLTADRGLDGSAPNGSVLTGDTILGRGSAVIAHPSGSMGAYFRSLDRLEGYGAALVLPGHGPALPDLAAAAASYSAHRSERLQEVVALVAQLRDKSHGAEVTVEEVADIVYAHVPREARHAAIAIIAASFEYLADTDGWM